MKALLVSTTPSPAVQDCLRAVGSTITRAENGQDAVRCAEHGSFDMAVIVSTGAYMDLVETYLHIRDLKPSMEIVLFAEKDYGEREDRLANSIATTFSNTHALNLEGLSEFLRMQSSAS
jgi:hypothetical protein